MKTVSVIFPYENRLPLQVTATRTLMPRYGVIMVAGALRDAGYATRVFCELSGGRVDWDAVWASDAVCFSLMSFCAPKGYEYARRVRERSRAVVIFGGSHASVLPEDCLPHCDYVVRNEGEHTLVELLDALRRGAGAADVPGVSFRGADGNPVHNPGREFPDELPLLADPDLVEGWRARSLGFYLRDMLRNGVPRFNMAVAQASRGCPYDCKFCFAKYELGIRYRKRDPERVVEEIALATWKLRTKYVFIVDNDFTHEREHALEILRRIEARFRGDVDLFFFSRIFIARDAELMEAIERAGRCCVAVGVESVEPATLELFNKGQTLEDIRECAALFRRYKILPHLLFVFGADTDTTDSIRAAVKLAIEHRVFNVGFCSLYDFPTREKVLGQPQLLPDRRFIHRDWRFYSGNFVVHYPRRMPPSVLQREISAAYQKFYNENKAALYQFRPTGAVDAHYVPMLKRAEEGFYDRDGQLIEERLPGPLAATTDLKMRCSRAALAVELGRFYLKNLTRLQAWRFLISLAR